MQAWVRLRSSPLARSDTSCKGGPGAVAASASGGRTHYAGGGCHQPRDAGEVVGGCGELGPASSSVRAPRPCAARARVDGTRRAGAELASAADRWDGRCARGGSATGAHVIRGSSQARALWQQAGVRSAAQWLVPDGDRKGKRDREDAGLLEVGAHEIHDLFEGTSFFGRGIGHHRRDVVANLSLKEFEH